MKYILLAFLFAPVFASAQIKALKGAYIQTPVVVQTDKPFDDTWNKTLEAFKAHNLTIRTIDKASGIVVSEPQSFLWSFEDKKGNLKYKDAPIVLQKMPDMPEPRVTAQVKAIIQTHDGKSVVSVNMENINAIAKIVDNPGVVSAGNEVSRNGYYPATSTGFYETQLANEIVQ